MNQSIQKFTGALHRLNIGNASYRDLLTVAEWYELHKLDPDEENIFEEIMCYHDNPEFKNINVRSINEIKTFLLSKVEFLNSTIQSLTNEKIEEDEGFDLLDELNPANIGRNAEYDRRVYNPDEGFDLLDEL